LICAAGVDPGTSTTVRNPYPKPDVIDLARYLDASGFIVDRSEWSITVTKSGPAKAVRMHVTPDLSEIMTYLTLAVLTGHSIALKAEGMARAFAGLAPEREVLARMGIVLALSGDELTARTTGAIRSADIDVTSVGVYSDHQPFFALLLTRGDRPATIREFVWKTRFDYVEGLEAFGARVERVDGGILVYPSLLSRPARPVAAYDLRMAGMLVVASLTVGGGVVLRNMGHLDRGYSAIWQNLGRMGGSFKTASSMA
jgi:UDP-N-acetylglucosamine 1-carboxyvinyltransferase